MPFASINSMTNLWNFHEKTLRIGWAGKWDFFESARLIIFFFSKNLFFLLHLNENTSPFLWGIIYFCTMDSFFRILENTSSELVCPRLYIYNIRTCCKIGIDVENTWLNFVPFFILFYIVGEWTHFHISTNLPLWTQNYSTITPLETAKSFFDAKNVFIAMTKKKRGNRLWETSFHILGAPTFVYDCGARYLSLSRKLFFKSFYSTQNSKGLRCISYLS